MKTLYLIDISSFFFRSYYAVPPHMTSPKGLPTNALYGTLSMLLKLMEQEKAGLYGQLFRLEGAVISKSAFSRL